MALRRLGEADTPDRTSVSLLNSMALQLREGAHQILRIAEGVLL
jgi:hypothetical protein